MDLSSLKRFRFRSILNLQSMDFTKLRFVKPIFYKILDVGKKRRSVEVKLNRKKIEKSKLPED
ncbi:hypothetical protein EO92_17185 [Methanosarcina sp. 2.H.A.1B.4]|nr:hypothetical protein EO92_17185 [Methanosarcina sp. 2.H.A.1B.4]